MVHGDREILLAGCENTKWLGMINAGMQWDKIHK